jgi:hypothetical protein
MANYAVIKNDIVENVIVAETEQIAIEVTNSALCIDVTNEYVGIGWKYINGEFIAPVIEKPAEDLPKEES